MLAWLDADHARAGSVWAVAYERSVPAEYVPTGETVVAHGCAGGGRTGGADGVVGGATTEPSAVQLSGLASPTGASAGSGRMSSGGKASQAKSRTVSWWT